MAGRHRKPAPARLRTLGIVAATSACAGGLVAVPGTAAAAPAEHPMELGDGSIIGLLDGPSEAPAAPGPPNVAAPAGPQDEARAMGDRIVREASKYEGTPYRWGAEGPNAFDCSGLTQVVFERFGVELPRTSQDQYDASTKMPQADAQPGDMIFLHDDGDVYHVGIYAGEGTMWHAPEPGERVQLEKINESDYRVGRAVG